MNQTSKSVGVCLLLCLITTSCKKYTPPEVETCISRETNSDILICDDPRLPDNQRQYDRPIDLGDICTNGNDYSKLKDYCADMRVKLIECESR